MVLSELMGRMSSSHMSAPIRLFGHTLRPLLMCYLCAAHPAHSATVVRGRTNNYATLAALAIAAIITFELSDRRIEVFLLNRTLNKTLISVYRKDHYVSTSARIFSNIFNAYLKQGGTKSSISASRVRACYMVQVYTGRIQS